MSDPRAKVRQLIALALGTSNPHERESAAVQACRLIDKHKLLDATKPLSAREVTTVSGHRVVVVESAWDGFGEQPTMRDLFEVLRRGAGVTNRPPPSRPPSRTPTAEDFEPATAPEHTVANESNYPVQRVTKVPGWCARCGLPIPPGQIMTVSLDKLKREMTWHRPCWDKAIHE